MAAWKQAALALVALVLSVFAWARIDPGAAAALGRIGLPAGLVSLVAGSPADKGGGSGGQGGPAREVLVITATVAEDRVSGRVNAIGDGLALHSVAVVPQSSGPLAEVIVRSGDRVRANDILARLDARAETIARDRAALALATAQEAYDRVAALVESRTATAVQLSDAKDARDTAELALKSAGLTLELRSIRAPIDGIAGLVTNGPGDYVTPQSVIATLDDRSSILIDFWIPERFNGLVAIGQAVAADPLALPGEHFAGTVAAIDSRIQTDSRTLRVRAMLDNTADRLRPGMAFEVAMDFVGAPYPSVDPLAVQWSSDGPYVWAVRDGKAMRVAVTIVQRDADKVLVDGDIKPGEAVVTQGVQSLREGTPVRQEPAA